LALTRLLLDYCRVGHRKILFRFGKLKYETDRQTDRQTHTHKDEKSLGFFSFVVKLAVIMLLVCNLPFRKCQTNLCFSDFFNSESFDKFRPRSRKCVVADLCSVHTHAHTQAHITIQQDLVWNSESNKAVTRYWSRLHSLKPCFIYGLPTWDLMCLGH
jgi:hypothetical protein